MIFSTMLKCCILTVLLALCQGEEAKPHLVIILADDLGYNDIGYNNAEVFTPEMDAIANSEGVILTNNYVQAACTPSRAALMTGRYPSAIGMQHGVLSGFSPHCLPTDVPLMSDKLRGAGYQTHLAGKWHLGTCSWNCTPKERGFDTFRGMYEGAGDFYSHRYLGGYDWRNQNQSDTSVIGVYTTDVIRDRALEIITDYEGGDNPLFLYLAFTAPHTPLQAPQQYKDMYPDLPEPRKTYLAMVTAMDDAVGKIVQAMKDNGLWDNTFLMFSSDNGGEHGGHASNLPLRGGKASLFEGGNRVPGFVAGPKVANPGSEHEGLFHITDWLPTFLSIAGEKYDKKDFNGVDQSKMLLKGKKSDRDEIIYNVDIETTGVFYFGNAAIRQGDLKMIWGFPGMVDGYSPNLIVFEQNDDYLELINTTIANYTDLLDPRPSTYWLSPQEIANQQEIVNLLGIEGITAEEVEHGRGQVLLFNLAADEGEQNNLANNEEYANIIKNMKKRIVDYIKADYLAPPESMMYFWPRVASPMNFPPLFAWTPGWCENAGIDLTTTHWDKYEGLD